MNTILEKPAYENIVDRINKLSPTSERNWGKMTPNQMLCHLSDPMRDILGIRAMQPLLPPAVQQQLKGLVLRDNNWEHDLQTFPPYSQDEDGGGTKPISFEQERRTLVDLRSEERRVGKECRSRW